PGLSAAAGTPRFRAVLSVGWAPEVAAPEPNIARQMGPSGLPSASIGSAPGSVNPSSDTPALTADSAPPQEAQDLDGDGVPDLDDNCPSVVGDPNAPAPQRGCPPDADEDGIIDANDACPTQPGVPSDDSTK